MYLTKAGLAAFQLVPVTVALIAIYLQQDLNDWLFPYEPTHGPFWSPSKALFQIPLPFAMEAGYDVSTRLPDCQATSLSSPQLPD